MEEKVLIESTLDKKKFKIWNIAWLTLNIILVIVFFISRFLCLYEIYHPHYIKKVGFLEFFFKNLFTCWNFDFSTVTTFILLGTLFIFIISLLLQWIVSQYKMTITDKNVYGKSLFRSKIILPIHMVSAYSVSKLFSKVTVTTASGATSFLLIENWEEIGNVLSTLINKRQEDTAKQSMQSPQQQSGLDELKKLKELLDLGILTQEEYDEKKKQMLKL